MCICNLCIIYLVFGMVFLLLRMVFLWDLNPTLSTFWLKKVRDPLILHVLLCMCLWKEKFHVNPNLCWTNWIISRTVACQLQQLSKLKASPCIATTITTIKTIKNATKDCALKRCFNRSSEQFFEFQTGFRGMWNVDQNHHR